MKKAYVSDHVSAHFPSTFITDGNIGSFEEQGLKLADKLSSSDVGIVDVFYSKEEAELGLEY